MLFAAHYTANKQTQMLTALTQQRVLYSNSTARNGEHCSFPSPGMQTLLNIDFLASLHHSNIQSAHSYMTFKKINNQPRPVHRS
jgi:hypothetical protein